MKDELGRRLRYTRAYKKPKNIEIGERDIAILSLLARYRYLRKDFMLKLLGKVSEQKVTRRLRDLYDLGYINRPEEQWRAMNARYSAAVYELDTKGEQLLRDNELYPLELSSLTRKSRNGAIRQYPHSMMICDTLASIEIGLMGTNHELVTWEQILTKHGTLDAENPFKMPCTISYTYPKTQKTHYAKTFIIPDGIFGIKRPDDTFSFFALEAERGNGIWRNNLEQPSFLKKILAYQDIISRKTYKEVLGIPNMRVLVVSPLEKRAEHMRELVQEIIGSSNIFLFHHIPTQDEILKAPKPFPELATSLWQRAGNDPTTLV